MDNTSEVSKKSITHIMLSGSYHGAIFRTIKDSGNDPNNFWINTAISKETKIKIKKIKHRE